MAVKQDDVLPSCFNSHSVNDYLFAVYLVPHYLQFYAFVCVCDLTV